MPKFLTRVPTIIGVKDLRQNLGKYVDEVAKGKSFTVVRRSKPVFIISPPDEDGLETLIDFTEIDPRGVHIRDLIAALEE